MKLYIAYYESYVSIIEGKYNRKKDKFNIKNCTFLSAEDVNIDLNDKYSLLKEALKINKSKVKDVVLCLNTKDIIIKSTDIHKVSPKDLDGIMNNEMDEIMSLDYEQYIFSYEVTREGLKDNRDNLDLIVAAVINEEVENILSIFKEFNLNLERIDTMSTAYNRLLKKIEYDNIIMLNVGSYGSIVNIFKEDTLFIHDNIPVKINEKSNHYVYSALVEEIKGLMNYYSSRNYGNNVDTIVIIGESDECEQIKSKFVEDFSSNIINGIENLFDIENDITGNLNTYEISKVCDILGSMCIYEDKKTYSSMNLLPEKLKNKQKLRNSLKQYVAMVPIALLVMFAPYIVFGAMDMKVKQKIDEKQGQLDEIMVDYEEVQDIQSKIETAKGEIDIYKMLRSKEAKWSDILNAISKSIPYRADLTNINVYYNAELLEEKEKNDIENQQVETNNQSKDSNEASSDSNGDEQEIEEETHIYDQVPNTITLEGEAPNSYHVGQFVYNLNQISYFKSVNLKSTTEDKDKGVQKFNIVLVLKEGAVHGK